MIPHKKRGNQDQGGGAKVTIVCLYARLY